MKRIFVILICLTLALLSGCGNESKSTGNQNTETKHSTSNITSSEAKANVSEETHNTETTINSVYKDPTIDYATAEDAENITDRLIELIDEYRTTEGACNAIKLSELTEYAKYRSRQLVTNFAHDNDDERAAATALQYGKYVDLAIHGLTDEPYYTANAREAIAQTDLGGITENIAKHLAQLFFQQ